MKLMRFSNENYLRCYKVMYAILGSATLLFLAYKSVVVPNLALEKYEALILIGLIFGLYFWYKRAKYFEYDSNGFGLVLISKGILLSDFTNYREQRIEISKDRLKKYKIKNWLVTKKLYLYLNTSKGIKKVSFDVSLLGKQKTKALELSLNKIIRENSSN